MAHGYSGNMIVSIGEADDPDQFTYILPEEGATLWIDNMAIPNEAASPCTAHTFIDFLLDAENGGLERTIRLPLDSIFTPALSPDGGTLAIIGVQSGASDLYLLDLESEKLLQKVIGQGLSAGGVGFKVAVLPGFGL